MELTNQDVERYSRQMMIIRKKGQEKLLNAKVLIVGCGGLGSPAGLYLASGGIGCIGLVDYDVVEVCNLQRQIAHTTNRVGMLKTESEKITLQGINPSCKVNVHSVVLNRTNAIEIISQYDIVLDATDNVPTRYLLNDACVLTNKPLVSASALKFEGQLTVYHHNGGPCYRCLFPEPPPASAVTNCSEGGILGPVVGMLGSLQALEVINIATGLEPNYSGKLLLFDGKTGSFRVAKLRSRQPDCAICGDSPKIKGLIDYEQFCSQSANDKPQSLNLIAAEERLTCFQLAPILNNVVLVDVRDEIQFELCSIPGSTNIPLSQLKNLDLNHFSKEDSIVCICRRGNNSQRAVELLKSMGYTKVKDLIGGIQSWKQIDATFPIY